MQACFTFYNFYLKWESELRFVFRWQFRLILSASDGWQPGNNWWGDGEPGGFHRFVPSFESLMLALHLVISGHISLCTFWQVIWYTTSHQYHLSSTMHYITGTRNVLWDVWQSHIKPRQERDGHILPPIWTLFSSIIPSRLVMQKSKYVSISGMTNTKGLTQTFINERCWL